ncbi:uncharacterized protein LOC122929094 [Bufo gargarizans]|uniref:uncharacterized protein LOC122929094 n=1 Tax=Bufo gargarizans TaxID=30331 RepID=UPI001CF3ED6A|nr:uncharacterized protein LOC122929094 [Bufo gargarizans]
MRCSLLEAASASYPVDMAVISDDSPAHEKITPVDSNLIAYGTSIEEEGFSINKTSKKFNQPCKIDQDSEEKSPPPETATESPIPLPAQKMKKRRQRKRKRKKIKAVVVIKGRRTKPGILSGKYRLKLPKTFTGNCLPLIALCLFCQCHLVHSGFQCANSFQVSDFPVTLSNNDQNFFFEESTFCPERVLIFRSCLACFRGLSLEMNCTNAMDIQVKYGKGNLDGPLVPIICKVSKTSVEDEDEDVDVEISGSVPVTDFPIVIKQFDQNKTFQENEVIFCPNRVVILKSCSACFTNKSLLEISCRKNGGVENRQLFVEHGKGQGITDYVELNSKEYKKTRLVGGKDKVTGPMVRLLQKKVKKR